MFLNSYPTIEFLIYFELLNSIQYFSFLKVREKATLYHMDTDRGGLASHILGEAKEAKSGTQVGSFIMEPQDQLSVSL